MMALADFVAEVGDWKTAPDRREFLKAIYYARSMWRRARGERRALSATARQCG